MKIYNYDPASGAFIGESEADKSPVNPGAWLVPAFATNIAPPSVPAGKYAAFDGAEWRLLDDVGPMPESINETVEQTIARYEAALDAHLDATARMHRYDNRFTFALRAAYPGPWHADGVAFAEWMDGCNAQAYALLKSVLDGDVSMPSIEDFINGLPDFVKP